MPVKSLVTFLFLFVSVASADMTYGYSVVIDTSSQSGNNGAIYFQFAPGLDADLATVAIDSFSIGAPGGLTAAPPPFSDGNVTGSLDSLPLTIDNSQALNDYEHYLTYGSTLMFHVTFDLPNTLTGASGSELVWQLTAADGITPVLTLDDSGNIGAISYDPSGNFTVDTLGNGAVETITATTPEPAMTALIGIGALLMGLKKATAKFWRQGAVGRAVPNASGLGAQPGRSRHRQPHLL
jgi:hypothetical protein